MATLSLLPEQELDSATNSDALFPSVARVGFPALMELLEIWYPFMIRRSRFYIMFDTNALSSDGIQGRRIS
jgi:hypothetical protein